MFAWASLIGLMFQCPVGSRLRLGWMSPSPPYPSSLVDRRRSCVPLDLQFSCLLVLVLSSRCLLQPYSLLSILEYLSVILVVCLRNTCELCLYAPHKMVPGPHAQKNKQL